MRCDATLLLRQRVDAPTPDRMACSRFRRCARGMARFGSATCFESPDTDAFHTGDDTFNRLYEAQGKVDFLQRGRAPAAKNQPDKNSCMKIDFLLPPT